MTEDKEQQSENAKAGERLTHAYEQLAEKTKAFLSEVEEKSEEWLDDALEKAEDAIERAGDYTKEELKQAREFLRRDLAATEDDFERLFEATKKSLDPSRLGAGFLNLVEKLADSGSSALSKLSKSVKESLTYKTGEVTGPGTLECTECEKELHMDHTGHIPPCPGCKNTTFHKRY